ncbi:MAG: hypothetical protein DI598_04455 [Pseudopedobacter saltans]|uniref:Glycosyltransferase 2-like domain-containing protein n=1 Tax=Pseudopedobacter saltans TaxID=151895 RepID=A0A2W5F495_9SPHI|nr:MAG: hypothetical protein DI598_04455 [Pseudopedobacter saltans]
MISFPKISVVISTFNGSKYVDSQIESIVNQLYTPFQIIISDDKSTDDTLIKLKLWQDKFPSLVEIYQQTENIGYNRNFEFCLKKVRGDYVAISDQDDIWHEDKLLQISQSIHDNPDFNVFHHDEGIIGIIGEEEILPKNKTYWKPYEGNGVNIVFLLNRLTGHKLIFESSLLKYILPFPGKVIYDWWINVVVAVHGNTKYINKKLMDYRMHAESAYFSKVSQELKNVTEPIKIALKAFSMVEGMKQEDQSLLSNLVKLYNRHIPHRFDLQLFIFFFRNRHILFRDYVIPFKFFRKEIFLLRMCRAYSKW